MTDLPPELPFLSQPREKKVRYVSDSDQLQQAVADLAAATGPFALDAERASGFKYSQRAYLVQIYRHGSAIYLIDVTALADAHGSGVFDELAVLLSTDEWVLHAASQDLPCLAELGFKPSRLFDTELGSRLAGLPRVGLGAVTETLLGLRLAKEHSAVDWSIRPLHPDWLNYAALDVDVLLDLRLELSDLIAKQGKTHIAEAEFDHLTRFKPKPAKVDRWRGAKGLHEIKDARALAVARALWQAREELGQRLDVSPGRLVPDLSITAVAKSTPKSKPELSSMKSFAGRASRNYIDVWWKAVQDGLLTRDLPALKPATTAIPNHRIWPQRYPEADLRLRQSRAVVLEVSEELNIPAENLITPDYLRTISWQPPQNISTRTIEEALLALGARLWQTQAISAKIAEAWLKPPRLEDDSVDTPEVQPL
jgi:ribonuclease D